MTSHSASSKQKEFGRARARVKQNKPAHIVRSKRTDRMRERGRPHTPRSVVPLLYFTLLHTDCYAFFSLLRFRCSTFAHIGVF